MNTTQYLRLNRPTTGTKLTIKSPIHLTTSLGESEARELNDFVDQNYPDFDIIDFWNKDQKRIQDLQFGAWPYRLTLYN